MSAMASQINGVSSVCSTVGSGAVRRKHQSPAYRLCVGNSPVIGEFPAQGASNAKMFPFDYVIMWSMKCPCEHLWLMDPVIGRWQMCVNLTNQGVMKPCINWWYSFWHSASLFVWTTVLCCLKQTTPLKLLLQDVKITERQKWDRTVSSIKAPAWGTQWMIVYFCNKPDDFCHMIRRQTNTSV